jgi:threonine dehydrogenase-like Zn-dependent dehydrogenase
VIGWSARGGGLRRESRPSPRAGGGEALLRTRLSGICGTDLEILRGYLAFGGILGHEFVAEVVDCPERPELEGRRAVGEINAGCGTCSHCRGGDPRHCPGRSVLGILGRDGCHAESFLLPAVNLIPLPDGLDDESAVFAEPVAAALEVLEQLPGLAGEEVLVLGDGRLGRVLARVLRQAGVAVSLLGREREGDPRPAGAGVELLTDPEATRERFRVAVEATGRPEGFVAALDALRPRGTLVLKSTYEGGAPLPMARVVVDEIRVLGSRCGRMEPAVEALAEGRIAVRDLIDAVHPLEEAPAAFERAARPGTFKVLLRP